ncbi:MAG: TolB family protein [Actinomycetota bacterium]
MSHDETKKGATRPSWQRKAIVRAALALGISAALLPISQWTPGAEAAFPARNGRIVFEVDVRATADPSYYGLTGDLDLFSVSPRGQGLVRLTQGPAVDYSPAWSPDGSRIAFTRAALGQAPGDIYLMDPDGSDQVNLTRSPARRDHHPSWSPDGTQIAFNCTDGPTEIYIVDVCVINADGGGFVRLTSEGGIRGTSDEPDTFQPAWSPDGSWIAFSFYGGNGSGLALIAPDGSRRHTIVKSVQLGGELVFSPSWSPTGKTIAFIPSSGEEPGPIWTVDVDGTGLRRLTRESDYWEVDWSPDGRRLAVSRLVGEGFRLYTLGADGSKPRRVVDLQLETPAEPDWGPRP